MSADVLHRSMVMLASCSALVAVSHGKLSKVTSGSGAREREREREGDTQPFLLKSTCRFLGALEDAPPSWQGVACALSEGQRSSEWREVGALRRSFSIQRPGGLSLRSAQS